MEFVEDDWALKRGRDFCTDRATPQARGNPTSTQAAMSRSVLMKWSGDGDAHARAG
jgi:hypothetical protein